MVRVYCDANYYGADCNTLCIGRDDSSGHYYCDKTTGNKVCLDGWRGQNCLTRKYSKRRLKKVGSDHFFNSLPDF